jgi:phage host-nuclease inhibitor protein Gam
MKKRIKVTLNPIPNRIEAEAVMNDLANAANYQRQTIAKRDAEVLAINNKYAGNLAVYEEAIGQHTARLQSWAETHPEEFAKGKKSLEFACGTLGFRTGNPKLSLISRAWNWDKVLEKMSDGTSQLLGFIRLKEEVDKESLLASYEPKPEVEALFREHGIKVVQDESFFVEPALTDTDVRQTSEAK